MFSTVEENNKLKLLITGCGRSGTKYVSSLLNMTGVLCGHESVFSSKAIRRNDIKIYKRFVAEVSWLAIGAPHSIPKSVKVLHQTRNPVKVIRSKIGINFFLKSTSCLKHVLSCLSEFELDKMDPVNACMEFWIQWNGLAASVKTPDGWHYRIEDMDVHLLTVIYQAAGYIVLNDTQEKIENALKTVPKNINSRQRDESITWASLPNGNRKERLASLAECLGYSMQELEDA